MKNWKRELKCKSQTGIGFGLVLVGLSLVMLVTDILFASGLAMMVMGSNLMMGGEDCG